MGRVTSGYPVGQVGGLVAFAAGLWLKFDLGVMLIVVGVILAVVFVLLERFDAPPAASDATETPTAEDDDGQVARAVPKHLADEHAELMTHEVREGLSG